MAHTREVECIICGNVVGYMNPGQYKRKRALNIRCEGCIDA